MMRKRQVIATVVIFATRLATAAWAAEPAEIAVPNPHAPAIEDPYPPAAKALNLPGHAVLGCSAAADGSLHNCKVVSEDPPSWGFGQGALKAATAINLGVGAPDRYVQVPIGFELDEKDISNPLIKTRGHLIPDDQTVWLKTPNANDLASAFPPAFRGDYRPGVVEFACRVGTDGKFAVCVILSEQPKGKGLAAAAGFLLGRSQLSSRLKDGRSVENGVVRTKMQWTQGP